MKATIILTYPAQFSVTQIGPQTIKVDVPCGEGPLFTKEAERFTTALLGPNKAARLLDQLADDMLAEVVKQSAMSRGEEPRGCHDDDDRI